MFAEDVDNTLEHSFATKSGCIVTKGDHILVIKTDRGWEFPKGSTNPGEGLINTAARETYEETGIRCRITCQKPIICDNVLFYYAEPISDTRPSPTNKAEKSIKKSAWKLPSDVRNKFIQKQRHLLDLIS